MDRRTATVVVLGAVPAAMWIGVWHAPHRGWTSPPAVVVGGVGCTAEAIVRTADGQVFGRDPERRCQFVDQWGNPMLSLDPAEVVAIQPSGPDRS